MCRTFLKQVHENTPRIRLCLLIAKKHVLPLYQGVGFSVVGLSSVVHGKGVTREASVNHALIGSIVHTVCVTDPWFEMKYVFSTRRDVRGVSDCVWGRHIVSHASCLFVQLAQYQVDAFSSEPFRGNPAAVLILSAKYVRQAACAGREQEVTRVTFL